MELLSKYGYFEGIGNPFRREVFDAKDANRVRTACLNFARDRVDLMRYFSKMDIQVVAEFGCPVLDRKVVNAAKRLRFHLGIGEENVCSWCSLRGNCERAYLKPHGIDGGYTVDIMHLLLTYGLDYARCMVDNKLCLNERITESVRKLLKEMVKYSKELNSNPQISSIKGVVNRTQRDGIDWICFRCKFMNIAGNMNCLQCDGGMRKSKKDNNHLELKKGDWLCEKMQLHKFQKEHGMHKM